MSTKFSDIESIYKLLNQLIILSFTSTKLSFVSHSEW